MSALSRKFNLHVVGSGNVKWRLIKLEASHPALIEDFPFLPLSYLSIAPLSLSLSLSVHFTYLLRRSNTPSSFSAQEL
jgi:hypothetical protein